MEAALQTRLAFFVAADDEELRHLLLFLLLRPTGRTYSLADPLSQ